MLVLIFIPLITAIETGFIPKTRAPPKARKGASMMIHESLNEIFIFGGSEKTETLFNDVWGYNLNSDTWKEYRPLTDNAPAPRYACASFVHNNFLYIYGGNSNLGPLKDLWKFDPNNVMWEVVPTINNPRTRFMAAFKDYFIEGVHYMCLYGGYIQGGLGPRLYTLNIDTLTWSLLGYGPFGSAGGGLSIYKDTIYLTGGLCNCTYDNIIEPNPYTYRYNLTENNWEKVETTGEYITRSLFGYNIWDNYLYNFFGWSDINYDLEPTIMRLDLTSNKWETLIPDDLNEVIQYYAGKKVGNNYYFFGGSDATTINNKLMKYSIEDKTLNIVTKKYPNPSSISNACMVAISQYIYLFGGMIGSTKLNDLWRYDIIGDSWNKMKTYGDIPSPRSHIGAAAEGDIMIIWGGKGTSGYLNDAFQYNSLTRTWKLLKFIDINPTQRYGVCITLKLPYFYLFGGDTVDGASSILWQYDVTHEKYERLDANIKFTQGFGHACELRVEDGDLMLYVIYGTGDGDTPIGFIQKHNFRTKKWKTIRDPGLSPDNRSRSVVKLIGDKVYIIGGQTWATKAYSDILEIDMSNNNLTHIGNMPIEVYLAPSAYVGSRLYMYGGGSAYDETIRFLVPNSNFMYINLFSVCSDNCDIICSPGTYKLNSTYCALCEPGSYSLDYGSEKCSLCPPGTYNNIYGSNSDRQCYPCSVGYFNDKYGQVHCRKCFESYVCPVGTMRPSESSLKDSITSVQPRLYSRPTAEANAIALNVQMAVMAVGILIVIIVLCTKKTREMIKSLDIYTLLHNYEFDQPLYKRKTFFGSIFTLIFLVLAGVIVSQSLVIYFKDNIYETKSLIPLVVLEKDVSKFLTDFNVTVTLSNYGGECITKDVCNENIGFSTSRISYEATNFNCYKDDFDCSLFYQCNQCEIKSDSSIIFSLKELYSYTTAISVNFTSGSSIPGQISSMKIVKVAKNTELFRGNNPTMFYFTVTPSYYVSSISNIEKYTGYHIASELSPVSGSSFTPDDMGFTSNLYIQLSLSRDLNSLYTNRLPAQTKLALIMALLGSVPGILNLVGSVMAFIEGNYLNCIKNKKKKLDMASLKKGRKNAENALKTVSKKDYNEPKTSSKLLELFSEMDEDPKLHQENST
ncbi:hypothetical protein SteCoe_11147 [Stentor coeruleus]|uniref:Tyrosine-protein kinase ephrin type A/B receptor-like domain-containing protein n=1 Tax=Stentor coeruleus TaxID=5963 RepID=A0A1R2CDQ8_9CILI|nr:hypothetical protein SteCoe_11147 [Stentor coeruleus]